MCGFRRPFPVVLAILLVGGACIRPAQADDAAKKPTLADSSARTRPKEATFTAAVLPPSAKAGETVEYRITATVAKPWHIYSYATAQPAEGPRHTQFDFFDSADLKLQGTWKPSTEPTRHKEPAFPNLPFVEYHEGEVTWSTLLLVPPGTAPGTKTLRCQIYFQLCDDHGCKPPANVTVPDVTLNVLPGGAEASAAAPPPATASPEASKRSQSAVEKKIAEGLIPFLLFAAGGGLFALIMPCVWPMVPVTVNFFVKQGHARRGNTIGLALAYGLSIIVIFTLVGVLFSAFLGASSLQNLANAAWLNLLVAGVFILFGLSLLGLFEIRLPSFLLNASSRAESHGGLVGIFFMALTLTITSFTCTFPVVGGLLVVAAGKSYLYPVLGLTTFSAVLALPFFLLALAPGLLQRVPRSGDWMNSVRIVGGLIEIGAAFKFLNTAEIAMGATPDTAWFDIPLVLSIWVVLLAVSGLYLLGLFRTTEDHEQSGRTGPIRLLCGAMCLSLALYLSPALFGSPPQSRLFNLFVGLLPASREEGVHATSPDPAAAQRQEKVVHGVTWGMSYDQAIEQARVENKPVLIDFTGVNCANCRQMEREVLPRSEIRSLLEQFVTVSLYTDFVPIGSITPDQRVDLSRANQERQVDLVNDNTTPLYVVLTPQGKVVDARGGYVPAETFKTFLEAAHQKATK